MSKFSKNANSLFKTKNDNKMNARNIQLIQKGWIKQMLSDIHEEWSYRTEWFSNECLIATKILN